MVFGLWSSMKGGNRYFLGSSEYRSIERWLKVSEEKERRRWWYITLGHTARVLITLLRAEREGRELSITDLVREAGIHQSTFYTTVRRNLIEGGLIMEEVNPGMRVIHVKLTDRGRRLAQCLEELGIE